MKPLIRILVVDDHAIIRSTLCALLRAPDIEVVGEAGDGSIALHAVLRLLPDVVLMDYHMPVMDGLLAARLILVGPQPPAVILLGGETDALLITKAHRIGVRCVLAKDSPLATLHAAIRAAGANRPQYVEHALYAA